MGPYFLLLITLLALLTFRLPLVRTIQIKFDGNNYVIAHYSNGSIFAFYSDDLNNNNNLDIYFDYGRLIIEYPSGYNITFWKQFPVTHNTDTDSCRKCDKYYCNAHPVPNQGCTCGCAWCCWNDIKDHYYLCASNSAFCCSVSNESNYFGCMVGGRCIQCD